MNDAEKHTIHVNIGKLARTHEFRQLNRLVHAGLESEAKTEEVIKQINLEINSHLRDYLKNVRAGQTSEQRGGVQG